MNYKCKDELQKAIVLARQRKDTSLIQCLKSLKSSEKNNESVEVNIYTDFAPFSFYFERTYNGKFSGNGGIIFHGKHDNGGDGGSPTFSVNLTPVDGWCIHT